MVATAHSAPSSTPISITLRVWRQAGPNQPGRFVEYPAKNLNPNMSFLEMLDVVNDGLEAKGEEPIASAHDCREGICGTCSLVINGKPHGPNKAIASCQTYMRSFADGETIIVEPAQKPPTEPIACSIDPTMMSISHGARPKCSATPRPVGPRAPIESVSSTIR
jgi:ferredoxin